MYWSPCEYIQNEVHVFSSRRRHLNSKGWLSGINGQVTYLSSKVSSLESDINMRRVKARTATDRLSIIWKSGLSDKIKRNFFQATVVSFQLYGCTIWTLTMCMEKKLDRNCTRMLRAILNKSWMHHPTKQQLYDHRSSISKTIQIRRTRYAGHCWRSNDKLISDVFLWTLNTDIPVLADQPELREKMM